METSESWDLIAPVGRPDVLRAATLLASQLAEVQRYRVRLFVDSVAPLTAMKAQIDPALWLQTVGAFELLKLDLAQVTVPAENILRLFGAKMPRKYMERAIYGHRQRRLFKVHLLDEAVTPTQDSGPSHYQFIDAHQGDQAAAAGIIRERHSSIEIRQRWKTSGKVFQATLDSLGLGGHISTDALFICCWDAAIEDWAGLVKNLKRAGSRPIVLLSRNEKDADRIQTTVTESLASPLDDTSREIRTLCLPSMSWSQRDELVWISDVVITGHDDMAQRAIESGVPLLWLPEVKPGRAKSDHLVEWYTRDADSATLRNLKEALGSLASAPSQRDALRNYINSYPEMESLATSVAKRVARAPLMSRILPALSLSPPNLFKKFPLFHPSTVPATVPGQQ